MPENRFTGNNSGCWLHPEYDRLFRIASTTLQDGERAEAILGMVKVHTEQLPVFGDFYHTENIAVRKGLVGLVARWPPPVRAHLERS